MEKAAKTFQFLQRSGIVLIILLLGVALTIFTPTHLDRETGRQVSNFLNPSSLMQVSTETAFFAIMAVGITTVIISGGIDLSVGSIYALAGIVMAMGLRPFAESPWPLQIFIGLGLALGTGVGAGFLNGVMTAKLGVHPFIITLGTMWIYRGVAFVISKAESILVPSTFTEHFGKATLGLSKGLYPVPLVTMFVMALLGWILLTKTTIGRRVFAVGGSLEAARYAGLKIGGILTGVYVISGLCAGLAAFVGINFYGAASSNDAQGYELYVIASAVVGGASLSGGKGSAWGALFGALLIIMIRTAIRMLKLDQNYEWIIIGVAIIIAVVLDRLGSRIAEKSLATASQ
jgi:ribose/xylose/arabinose/galactoside ABC-type transport system permease subunit